MTFSSENLKVGDLSRDDSKNCSSEILGTSYFDAYQSHKKVAEHLLGAKLHRDAYHSLIIASECLLKGLFVSVRTRLFGSKKKPTQARIMVQASGAHAKDDNAFLSAKDFRHDLAKLKQVIPRIFPEFDKGDFLTEYAKLTGAIDDTIDWQDERYFAPSVTDRDWQKKADDLMAALTDMEAKALSNIFGAAK
jgi:hypothetical protein